MHAVVKTLLVLAGLGAVGGTATVAFGLYDVSARLGHVPGLSWVLNTTFRNSVDLYTDERRPMPELTAGMVRLGARHYDASCKVCHARPGEPRSATTLAMVPAPPHITEAVEDWTPREFHWIVQEGVKMSGMPYWPAEREDEAWAMVAFLQEVGEMSAQDYLELTRLPQIEGPPEAAYCAGCHGVDGRGVAEVIPRLDILGEEYLRTAIESYVDRSRDSGFMAQAVTEVEARNLPAIVAYFGALPAQPGAPTPDLSAELVAQGRDLAMAATNDPKVPACAACHGPSEQRRTPGGPELAGQNLPYLAEQLRLWREGKRGGGPRAHLMVAAAQDLEDEDIDALAAYYASLKVETKDEGRPPVATAGPRVETERPAE